MYIYNPYAYNLPKAQDGMNIRGARNQFREQENSTKDAANWFKDAGKWALNTVVAPFEILSGTNFYDPDMSYKGWEGFDNVFEGVSKGVGEALGYFYGGPAYGAVKEGISGIAGMFGGSKEYGGPIEKYQTQGQVMAPRQPIGANPNGSNVFSFQQGFNTPEQMQSFANLMSGIMGVYGSSMQTQPTQTTDVSKNNLPQPNPNPNATGVSDATGPNMDSIGNLMKGIAGAGKDPIQGNTVNYGDPEVAGNAGAGIKHFVDSIAGNDPKDLAFQKGHQDRALAYLNASESFIPSVTRAEYGNKYQMGGTAIDPMKRAAMVQHHSQGLHTPADKTAEIGYAFHGLGESVGKAISGGGMSGGGGGGIMGMFGGGGQGGGGGIMDMIGGLMGGGGEGGSGGGGLMDMVGGMFGGESGNNFNFGNIMGGISNLGGMLGFEYGGDIPLGEPIPVRKGKSPYIATYYYENGGNIEKTSELPMDMEGFTDLEPGFRKSNMIEINSGKPHSDLNNPHTPLNVPVASFDEQGNPVTENVSILAEPGEFARKDPKSGDVTIFSKNLGFAKPAEKLGKKEERIMEKLKNPYDAISEETLNRQLNGVQNAFIKLEEEQKVAKDLKEEEDRMDLFQLAKNGGRITKKNTYRMGGKVKKLSEYQKDLLGMNDSMPKAQNSLAPEDIYDRVDQLEAEEGNPFKKQRKTKAERQKERETRRKLKELEKQQLRGESPMDKIEEEGIQPREASDLAKQIAKLPGGETERVDAEGNTILNPYTNEGARKAKELIEEEYGPLTPEGGLPQPPGGVEVEEEEEPDAADKNMMRRMSSGSNFLNDYINRMNSINASVRNRFEPYPNFYADYAREAENLMANAETDLPRYYEDMMAQKASQSVNALENSIRNMSGIGSSGYLANMQAARNKELGINQQAMATSLGQEMAQRNARAAQIAQNRLYEARGAETSFDRTQESLDAMDTAEMITARNILEANIAGERERNQLAQNNLLAQQMGWMDQTNPTMYDEQGNERKPVPVEYGGAIKKRMYEYGSRIKKERSQKADKAIQDFRSFMKEYNK